MNRCECSHPSSFHPDKVSPKNEVQQIAAHIRARFVDDSEKTRACMGELNGKPCPCQGFVEDKRK